MLTKSTYLKAIQCQKLLWLTNHKKKLLTPQDDSAKSKLKIGTEVGKVACELFPYGRRVGYDATNLQGMAERTKEWIDEGVETIYEATFLINGLFVMVDILRITPDGLEIYEVKSSTKVKDIYLHDVAFQYYVVAMVGYRINGAFVIHIDSSYVREESLNLKSLFSIVDVTEDIKELQEEIPAKIEKTLSSLADKKNEPKVKIDEQCHKPYICEAKEYCWRIQEKIPDYSMFSIFFLGSKKQRDLYSRDIIKIEDIPHNYNLTNRQRQKINCWNEQIDDIDHQQIEKFVKGLTYPLYHLDFETFQQAIPKWKGINPYRQIPFQYSLHIEHENGELEHKEFLAKEGEDPRENLAKRLIQHIPKDVMVLTYNMSFEKRVLKELAQDFDTLSNHLMAIHNNIVDLMMPFQKGYYMTPSMKGSFSIKYILPALVPNMRNAYDNLELIQNGGDAMNAFAELSELEESKKNQMRKALFAYCKLDTLAMVEILKRLRNIP